MLSVLSLIILVPSEPTISSSLALPSVIPVTPSSRLSSVAVAVSVVVPSLSEPYTIAFACNPA